MAQRTQVVYRHGSQATLGTPPTLGRGYSPGLSTSRGRRRSTTPQLAPQEAPPPPPTDSLFANSAAGEAARATSCTLHLWQLKQHVRVCRLSLSIGLYMRWFLDILSAVGAAWATPTTADPSGAQGELAVPIRMPAAALCRLKPAKYPLGSCQIMCCACSMSV